MHKRFLCVAGIFFALVMVGSCDDNKSNGGAGGGQPQAETGDTHGLAIKGLSTVSSRGTTAYQEVLKFNGNVIVNRKWVIKGHAAIVGPDDGRTVTVDINGPEGGGEFTLTFLVKIAKGPWIKAVKKVKVNPYPQFRVEVHNAVNGSLNPTSYTGAGGVMTASQEYVEYQYWTIAFVGDTTTFPDLINVRVQANNGCAICDSNWANGPGANIYLDFPKQGGGSVGIGGTVYNPGANRPYLRTPSGQDNYVWFWADGVQVLNIHISR